jgi:hypothetical protein
MEEAFEEGQGPHRAVESMMMMMMMMMMGWNIDKETDYLEVFHVFPQSLHVPYNSFFIVILGI